MGVWVFSEDLSVSEQAVSTEIVTAYIEILATFPKIGKIFFRQVKVTERGA